MIDNLPDSWQEIEIKAVNLCASPDLIVYENNPCETMAGVIATSEEDLSGIVAGWKVVITDVVYSNYPQIGVPKTINVYAREDGTVGPFAFIISFTVLISAGPTVTLTPNPVQVGTFDEAWDRVELKFEYGCGKEHLQVFSNPLQDCLAVSEVDIIDIGATDATATWPAVTPTPSANYDWELYLGSPAGSLIDSGFGYWNPGTLVLGLIGLTTATHYWFRVRSNCGLGEFSIWADAEFDTI